MLVIGAKGHAKEILDILYKQDKKDLIFFDDITPDLPNKLFNTFPIIRTEAEIKNLFKINPSFVLGVGGCFNRFQLSLKMIKLGGELTSVIANTANIGNFNVQLGKGLNLMHGSFISNDVIIGEGSLINTSCSIHHDVTIGKYCEISPGSILTGRVQVGDYTSIGSGTVILPKVKIGSNVIIGAGAIVTKDVSDNCVAVGIPAHARFK